jgi:hypothetical protein
MKWPVNGAYSPGRVGLGNVDRGYWRACFERQHVRRVATDFDASMKAITELDAVAFLATALPDVLSKWRVRRAWVQMIGLPDHDRAKKTEAR